jgi:DNA repair protein RadA/Sms
MVTDGSTSAPGSVTQVRDCAAQLTQYAKQTNTILLMIGHVTKGGALAGPRILEHMVDCVLYFEGDAGGRYRIIRAVKNRFGAVASLARFLVLKRYP